MPFPPVPLTHTPQAPALDIAQQILAREIGSAVEPAAVTAAVERLYERLSGNLRHSVGDDGYNALISRALAHAQPAHPVLEDMRGDTGIQLDRVAASANAHGVQVVSAAFESLLASLVDVLSGLIGADMVMNLLDPDGVRHDAPVKGQVQ